MEKTPDQLYEQISALKSSTERLGERIGDIASAIRHLAESLLKEPHNEQLAAAADHYAALLEQITVAADPQITELHVDQALGAIAAAVDEVIVTAANQQLDEASSAETSSSQQLLFDEQPAPNGQVASLDEETSQEEIEWIRPDRQITFDGLEMYDWPEPQHDRDTITVDRVASAFPAHRFVIHRGDRVSVHFNKKFNPGTVTGISIARDEVKVQYDGTQEGSGDWHYVGSIYPQAELEPLEPSETAALSDVIQKVNQANTPTNGFRDTDKVPSAELSESRESPAVGMDSLDSQQRPPEPVVSTLDKALQEQVYEDFAFEARVEYARQCLLAEQTDSRAFDTCFEMYDGEYVVVRLLQLAQQDDKLMAILKKRGWDDIEGTDSEDFIELTPDELAAKARFLVGSTLVGQGRLTSQQAKEFEDPAQQQPEPASETPYTIDDWRAMQTNLDDGQLNASRLKTEFHRMVANGEAIVADLIKDHKAPELKNWAARWTGRPESTKAANAKKIYESMLQSFALGQTISYRPFDGESYEEAVTKAVEAVTDQDIEAVVEQRQQRKAATEKALNDPETFEEWQLFVKSVGGYHELDETQKVAFERVYADYTRQRRRDSKEKTVRQIELDEDLSFTIKEGWHDKKKKPLWIVQLSNRIERESFLRLRTQAREFGGFYSDFKAADAGFQFYDEAAAISFSELLDGDVDNAKAQEAAKIRKMGNACERFRAVADTLERDCTATLEADQHKKKNTARRADMAAGMREDAQRGLALMRTLRSLADQLESGEIQYLDGVNAATQLTTITKLIDRAKYNHIHEQINALRKANDGHYPGGMYEKLNDEPLSADDIAFAEYPWPYVYRDQINQAMQAMQDQSGVIRSTQKLSKLIASAKADEDPINFKNDRAVEVLADFLGRAKAAGYSSFWFENCLTDYKRMQAANICNAFELRTAMRELLPYIAEPEGDDPIVVAEDALRGKKLPGFFPTPKAIIYDMLEQADIQPTHTVLEPSAGKGDILDGIRQAHPEVDLTGIECNHTLRDVLHAKGYADVVKFCDFLEHQGSYDRIIMNPPFEQGADIDHVRHAYELLSEEGRVVSIMCEGPFFRSDKKSQAFREWLDEVGASVESLPEDAFQGVEAFRQTGVKTRLVVIDK